MFIEDDIIWIKTINKNSKVNNLENLKKLSFIIEKLKLTKPTYCVVNTKDFKYVLIIHGDKITIIKGKKSLNTAKILSETR